VASVRETPGAERRGFRYFEEPRAAKWLYGSTQAAWLWLVVRLYLGYEWINAGWPKLFGSEHAAWIGNGSAMKGYLTLATTKLNSGDHPAVAYGWYTSFLNWVVSSGVYHALAWVVAIGEVAVGVALILGAFVGIAAFFGVVMNFNYMFAGSAGVNPLFAILGIFLVLAWRVAGYYGLDRWLLPALGTPDQPGTIFRRGGGERESHAASRRAA
jgi:thiosulfate dehydrogenase (quinone) large subunit